MRAAGQSQRTNTRPNRRDEDSWARLPSSRAAGTDPVDSGGTLTVPGLTRPGRRMEYAAGSTITDAIAAAIGKIPPRRGPGL
jgi:hypothetical protein